MLLDDPIAMYLDEGGKITPGFRRRSNFGFDFDIPPPDIGVPNIPMTATADTGVDDRDRDQFGDKVVPKNVWSRAIWNAVRNGQSSDPLHNIGNTYEKVDPLIQIANQTTPSDPLSRLGGGTTGPSTMYDDIPDLNVGDTPSFGNTEYIGA